MTPEPIERSIWQISKAGNLNRLKCLKEKLGKPGPEEVQIAVKAIGLNFADIFALFGLYSATPKGSFIPGLEYAGEIKAIGNNVSNFSVGDKVMGVTKFGGYCDHLNIDATYITPLPHNWSFAQGASFLVQGLTAYYALITLGALEKAQTVLIQSAAGGVGLIANQIAKKYNAFTIGAVGSFNKIETLKNAGFDQYIIRDPNFKANLVNVLGERPLHLVLECIGGKIFKDCYDVLSKTGRIVVYGSARYGQSGSYPNYIKLIWQYIQRPKIDPQKMIEENKSIMGFNLIWLYDQKDLYEKTLKGLTDLELDPPKVGHEFNFSQLTEAIKLFQSGKTIGKVIVNVN